MTLYVERRRTITARQVTPETRDAVAEWCGGRVLGTSVVYSLGSTLMEAKEGDYVIEESPEVFVHLPREQFEREWTPAEGE